MTAVLTRHLVPVAEGMLRHFPGLVIEGARQVGKSTLAAQLVGDGGGAVVTTLDDETTRLAASSDMAGFVAQAGDHPLVIDEIQRLPELTLAVKAAIDRDRRPGRFVLTGSSSLLRVRGTADSLAGRVARMTLYGFSRGEVFERRDDFASAVVSDAAGLPQVASSVTRSDYAELLAVGAYPALREASPRVRASWIDSYLQGIIARDMAELRRELQPARLFAVLRTLAGRQSAELVKATLAQETSVPARTITGYLDLLHDVGLVTSIPPWTPRLANREIGRAKTFVTDSAVAMRLARVSSAQLARFDYGDAFGAMLEAFVAAELLRQRGWSEQDFEIFHYRDRNHDEIDLVLELADSSVIGIEVKASSSFSAKHFKGLVRLREQLGQRFIAGIVLNTGANGFRHSDRLYGAPISALWEFSGGESAK